MRSRIIAAFAVVGLLFGGSALLPASAASIPEATPVAPANSVTSKSIKDGAVSQSDMLPGVNAAYLGTYNNTVGFPALKSDVAAKLDLGKGSVAKIVAAATITTIGGSFATGKTKVGEFTLPAGTWLVTSNAVFNRTEAAAAGDPRTRPQLALRYGDDYSTSPVTWGESAGTIMGVDISPTVGRELMGATVQTVTVAASVTVNVYGFGYDDAQGGSASGKLNVAAQITATKIG